MRVGCSAPVMMTLCVRIPVWSARTVLRLNGALLATPPAGDYARLRRVWQTGDVLELELDFRLRAWVHGTDFIDSAQARATALPGVVPPGAAPPAAVWSATRDGGWPVSGRLFPGTAAQLLVLDPQACAAAHNQMLTLCSVQPSTMHRPPWRRGLQWAGQPTRHCPVLPSVVGLALPLLPIWPELCTCLTLT